MHKLLNYLGGDWDTKFTDIGGNRERLGYLFKKRRVDITELAAELAMRGYERRKIFITVGNESGGEREEQFDGFNRNPYMIGFKKGTFEFTLVNVHLYWNNFIGRRLKATRARKPALRHPLTA